MQRQTQKITLFQNVTPVAITSSTDATPIVVTATAHGYVTGDRVLIQGHTTNIAANGIFKVTRITADTFSLQDEFTGADVAGSGAGAGASGFTLKAPPVINVMSFRNIIIEFGTTGTASVTSKVLGSNGNPETAQNFGPGYPRKDMPNFGATQNANTNSYSFVQLIPLDTGTPVAGGTGIVQAAADVNNTWEVNTNAFKYMTFIPTAWTQGALNAVAFLTDND